MGNKDITRWARRLRRLATPTRLLMPPRELTELPDIKSLLKDPDEEDWQESWGHLQGAASVIFGEIRSGGFVWELPPPVLSETVLAELKSGLDAAFWRFAHIFEDAA